MKTKYFLRNAVLAAMMLLPLTLAGCRYDLVEGPSMDMNEEKNAADYKDFILPPASLTATQGESKAVVLTWPAVKNAVQYQVFAAESPFSTFSKVSETTSTETEITIEEEAGITKYYCISAVNYYGTVSSKSVVAMGSTLAVPIITAIDASEEGNSVTVSWWMDNCSSDTYAADVSFNVNVYALSAPNIKFKTLTVDGDTRQVEIDGLTSKTEYYFEVEVVKADSTSRECSEKTSAETAHRVIPDAPTNVTVSQGETTSNITIKWQLPEGAWYRENSGVSGFVLHPLYFKIYRKLASQSDDKYEVIATAYVNANENWKYRNKENTETHKFIPKDAEELIPSVSDPKLDTPYESYIPGAEVYITDTTAVQGNKYTYYIQSITDDTPEGKIITADSSKSVTADGWLISVPSFSIKSDYTTDEGERFTKITFTYYLRFQNYDKPYAYFVKRVREPLDENGSADEKIFYFSTIDALNSNTDLFEPVEGGEENGYYKYTLYICNVGTDESNYENAIISQQANGKYLVTHDANAVPKISNFSVIDGYSDKFNLTWTYSNKFQYYIHYKEVSGNNIGEEVIYTITEQESSTWADGETVTYSHGAPSGSRRIYWLEASQGISAFAKLYTDEKKTEEKIFETLGKPEPSFKIYDYNTITVTWPKVQKSDGIYSVDASYEDGLSVFGTNTTCEIIPPSDTETDYKCVITKPEGFDDPTKSGRKINLTVKTQNGKTGQDINGQDLASESTSEPVSVCTVGPALVNLNISSSKSDNSIVINWNAVEGARGYLIRRITYAVSTQAPEEIDSSDFIEYPDIYYYDAIDNTLTTKNDDVVNAEIKTNSADGTFKLIDKYIAAPDNNSGRYALNQSKISWGIPYGYLVIPVKENGSKNDFEFNMRNVAISNVATYKNTQKQLKEMEKFGATKGYGLNVHAKKSESGVEQEITWDIPYNQTDLPSVYCREINGEDSKWNYISYKYINPEHNSVTLDPISKTKAYEYLIAYGKPAEPIKPENIPTSFIEDQDIGLSRIDNSYPDYTDPAKNVPEEKANKGYLLFMDDPIKVLETGEDFSEIVTMNNWNYDSKSIGPERAYVCIKNYNLSSDWKNVVELDEELRYKDDASKNDNTTVTPVNSEKTRIKIEPTTLMDGSLDNSITKGPLQVLRDAKHYYAIRLERGSTPVVVDNNKYAYRNINDYEFAKIVMVVFAQGMNKIGNLDFESKTIDESKDGGSGTISFTHNSNALKWGTEYSYTISKYSPQFEMPYTSISSFISISCNGKCNRKELGMGTYPLSFNNVTINVSKVNDNDELPDCYFNKTLSFSLSDYKNAELKTSLETIILTNEQQRRVFVPFRLFIKFTFGVSGEQDEDTYLNSYEYGWWPEN